MEKTAFIYGDSIMRGTVLGEDMTYHATIEPILKDFGAEFGIKIEIRSRFGITIERGSTLIKDDIAAGSRPDYAVIAYGGNDCNFKWGEIAAAPESEHSPYVDLPRFVALLTGIIDLLKSSSVEPVLMTLPPISGENYLEFLEARGNSRENILKWLGDADMIYRYHEHYSGSIARLAVETGCRLIDVRSRFLPQRNFAADYISRDGIHLKPAGYRVVMDAFRDYAAEHMKGLKQAKNAGQDNALPFLKGSHSAPSAASGKA